ncbi:MAG: hypothetical protein M3Z10_02710 [Gemmatimonadota bacterium]|nr:hypothetical protein [Gemmatimonadota bacterium]
MPDRFFTLSKVARSIAAALLLATAAASRVSAQTDYYNTDRGRPVQIEDAYTTERYAMELKLAPVRLEHAGGGVYNWGVDPEIAYGILPRTQVELGLPLAYREVGGLHQSGIAGLELSAMHSFNAETESWPALALRADLLAPVGSLAPSRAYPSLTGIATRTFTWGRVHLNGTATAGSATNGNTGADQLSRWLIGGAVDKTFPLRATLFTAEFYGRKPLIDGAPVEYTTGIGARHQISPTLALDAGVGRRLNGDAAGWYVTFGSAYAFSVASLLPTRR